MTLTFWKFHVIQPKKAANLNILIDFSLPLPPSPSSSKLTSTWSSAVVFFKHFTFTISYSCMNARVKYLKSKYNVSSLERKV